MWHHHQHSPQQGRTLVQRVLKKEREKPEKGSSHGREKERAGGGRASGREGERDDPLPAQLGTVLSSLARSSVRRSVRPVYGVAVPNAQTARGA